MHKHYLEKIDFNHHKYDIIDIIDMLMCEVAEDAPELHEHIEGLLYEHAYGKVISSDIAHKWVNSMKPVGEYWNLEETTQAMHSLGYTLDDLSFYVVSNMMYNDYHDLVASDDMLALRLAKDWLDDEDAKDCKLYEYWKHVIKK